MALNAEQQAAVDTVGKSTVVLAGAGSGKTRVLIERIVQMVKRGLDASSIVACTFTRAAAQEMRERLKSSELKPNQVNAVTVSTMHGLGLIAVQRMGAPLGYRPNVSVYGDVEVDAVLKEVGEYLSLYKDGKWRHGVTPLKNALYALDCGEEIAEDNPYKTVLIPAFQQRCKERNALPYSALITALRDIAAQGGIRKMGWQHFLVDEVQDLNQGQWAALAEIKNGDPGYTEFLVGDISQSIYSFRGAKPMLVQKSIENGWCDCYTLRSNYRSDPGIVTAANRLISYNAKSHKVIEMQAQRGFQSLNSNTVCIVHCENSAQFAHVLYRDEWQEGGTATVLCRNNKMLDKLAQELDVMGVKYTRIGRFVSRMHSPLFVKANSVLKCAANVYDDTAFMLARRGLGLTEKEYATLTLASSTLGVSRYEAFMATDSPCDCDPPLQGGDTPFKQALRWFRRGNYIPDINDGDLRVIVDWLTDYNAHNPDATINDYLDWLTLIDVQDEVASAPKEGITLMTIHASKGLEFPNVYLFGVNEGVIPSKAASKTKEGIEDERRLMYVAATRARDNLTLVVRLGKIDKPEEPSRFVNEMVSA